MNAIEDWEEIRRIIRNVDNMTEVWGDRMSERINTDPEFFAQMSPSIRAKCLVEYYSIDDHLQAIEALLQGEDPELIIECHRQRSNADDD